MCICAFITLDLQKRFELNAFCRLVVDNPLKLREPAGYTGSGGRWIDRFGCGVVEVEGGGQRSRLLPDGFFILLLLFLMRFALEAFLYDGDILNSHNLIEFWKSGSNISVILCQRKKEKNCWKNKTEKKRGYIFLFACD